MSNDDKIKALTNFNPLSLKIPDDRCVGKQFLLENSQSTDSCLRCTFSNFEIDVRSGLEADISKFDCPDGDKFSPWPFQEFNNIEAYGIAKSKREEDKNDGPTRTQSVDYASCCSHITSEVYQSAVDTLEVNVDCLPGDFERDSLGNSSFEAILNEVYAWSKCKNIGDKLPEDLSFKNILDEVYDWSKSNVQVASADSQIKRRCSDIAKEVPEKKKTILKTKNLDTKISSDPKMNRNEIVCEEKQSKKSLKSNARSHESTLLTDKQSKKSRKNAPSLESNILKSKKSSNYNAPSLESNILKSKKSSNAPSLESTASKRIDKSTQVTKKSLQKVFKAFELEGNENTVATNTELNFFCQNCTTDISCKNSCCFDLNALDLKPQDEAYFTSMCEENLKLRNESLMFTNSLCVNSISSFQLNDDVDSDKVCDKVDYETPSFDVCEISNLNWEYYLKNFDRECDLPCLLKTINEKLGGIVKLSGGFVGCYCLERCPKHISEISPSLLLHVIQSRKSCEDKAIECTLLGKKEKKSKFSDECDDLYNYEQLICDEKRDLEKLKKCVSSKIMEVFDGESDICDDLFLDMTSSQLVDIITKSISKMSVLKKRKKRSCKCTKRKARSNVTKFKSDIPCYSVEDVENIEWEFYLENFNRSDMKFLLKAIRLKLKGVIDMTKSDKECVCSAPLPCPYDCLDPDFLLKIIEANINHDSLRDRAKKLERLECVLMQKILRIYNERMILEHYSSSSESCSQKDEHVEKCLVVESGDQNVKKKKSKNKTENSQKYSFPSNSSPDSSICSSTVCSITKKKKPKNFNHEKNILNHTNFNNYENPKRKVKTGQSKISGKTKKDRDTSSRSSMSISKSRKNRRGKLNNSSTSSISISKSTKNVRKNQKRKSSSSSRSSYKRNKKLSQQKSHSRLLKF